jgi:hypothetical protein
LEVLSRFPLSFETFFTLWGKCGKVVIMCNLFFTGGYHEKMGRERAEGCPVYARGTAEKGAHDQTEYK